MMVECTEVFVHYREIARLVWNLGFWPNPELRQPESLLLYYEAMARLFEAIVLHSLGFEGRVEEKRFPGRIGHFHVRTTRDEVQLRVDEHMPDEPGHIWGRPMLSLDKGSERYSLRFMRLFQWDSLGPQDFILLEVLIERLDDHPDLVGHHALIEFDACSLWIDKS